MKARSAFWPRRRRPWLVRSLLLRVFRLVEGVDDALIRAEIDMLDQIFE
jgi:hypothetical protein